jgi:enoyl-CoA hydratase/carnithine racemase
MIVDVFNHSVPRKYLERIAPLIPGQPVERMTKRLMREGQHMRLESLLELSGALQSLAHATQDHKEAVSAFIEKRKPNFTGT